MGEDKERGRAGCGVTHANKRAGRSKTRKTKMTGFEKIYITVGSLVNAAQVIEQQAKLTMRMMKEKGALSLSDQELDEVLEGRGKTTFGKVLSLFKGRVDIIDFQGAELLYDALKYRNYIVHQFFIDHGHHLTNDQECENVLKELRRRGDVIMKA